jgi:hypothetical protein
MTTEEIKKQVLASIELIKTVAEVIRTAKQIPNGELYAIVMPSGISIQSYTKVLDTLKKAQLIEETPGHLLKWIGPNLDENKDQVC